MPAETLPDGGQINRSSLEAMLAWSSILGAHQVEILVAVAAVGPSHHDVRLYLQQRFCFSSRQNICGVAFPPVPESLSPS